MSCRSLTSITLRLIPLAVLLCFCISIKARATLVRLPVPGVAFSLTPNYGTAAIYFANGSFAEVAQIEGSPEYKAFMREESSSTLQTSLCDQLPSSLQRFTFNLCSRAPDNVSTNALLRALKYSVASYLGTAFCFADVVLPDPGQVYQRSVIEKAIKAVGLRQTMNTLQAGKLAVVANHLSKVGDDEVPEKVVLAIDYSGSGLNILLFCYDMGVIDILRQSYHPDLGAENNLLEHWQAVKKAILELTLLPFGHSPMGNELPNRIDKLVLYGDMTLSPPLLENLKEALDADLVEKARVFDSIFASAVGMAQMAYESMNHADFNAEPAWGCRWRSNLYREQREEL